ncbi:hypothetical protein BDN70DRAFT_880817 [Pholiota conissans]|uniref:Uncharacterized protein n=1 Tax=Pholiota conissans TaxID=109636 RepID=A0A9P5YYV6_9AGAR|nr:hypothetical protein BDN70DRAFT_880817 [Pholiota conissans]
MAHFLRSIASNYSSSIPATSYLTLEIPQEIIDVIVDEIARELEGNRAALTHLRSCALVSKGFNHSVCRYLFAVIDIYYGNPKHQRSISRLRRILEAHPPLVSYIRRLTIIISWDWKRNQKSKIRDLGRRLGMQFRRAISKWRRNLIWVLQRVHSAANLRSMTIRGLEAFPVSTWTKLDEKVSAVLISIAQGNTHLEHLELNDIMDVPVEILSRKDGNTFNSFQLSSCTLVHKLNFPANALSIINPMKILSSQLSLIDFRSVQSFSFYYRFLWESVLNPDILQMPVSHFPKLEFVSLGISGQKHGLFLLKQILTSDAPLLKEMNIELYQIHPTLSSSPLWYWNSLVPPSDVAHHNNMIVPIEKLSLTNVQRQLADTTLELRLALETMVAFIKCPMLPKTIIEISIRLHIRIYNLLIPGFEFELITPEEFYTGMHLFDNVLSDQSRFPSLKKLNLITITTKGDIDGDWLLRADSRKICQGEDKVFPRLASMGVSIGMSVYTLPDQI